MSLFDFGLEWCEPDLWEVIPDIEYEMDEYGCSLIWYYGTCWVSTKFPWCITPDHEVIAE